MIMKPKYGKWTAMIRFSVILTLLAAPLSSQEYTPDEQDLRSRMEEAELVFFRNDTAGDAVNMIELLRRDIGSLGRQTSRGLLLANSLLLSGYFELNHGSRSRAERDLEAAIEETETLLRGNLTDGQRSEAYRIAADAYLYLASIKGTLFQMTNGRKMRDYPIQALEADADNLRAVLSRSIFLVSVPRFAGGDVSAGVDLLRDRLSETSGPLRFRMLMWIGIGEREMGNTRASRSVLGEALEMMPGNSWAETELGKLD
jgi:hypothetical protein